MTHRRTRPEGQSRQYGVLVGTIGDGREDAGRSPHYEILVATGDGDYRIAVNVRSVDGSDVIASFDTAYTPPASLDLASRAAGAQGFAPLRTGADGDGLDYLREDGLVDLGAMRPIPPDGAGDTLGPLFDALVAQARADDAARVIAYGQSYRDAGRDPTFGFSPEQGVHDIHMMQGNPPGDFGDDDLVGGDGALFVRFGDGRVTAFFARFSTQVVQGD